MKIETFNDYMSEYISGAKSIEYIFYQVKISETTSNRILKPYTESYNLYFSLDGLLRQSIHFSKNSFNRIYFYKQKKLVQVVVYKIRANELIDSIDYYYNEDGLIDYVEGDNIEYNYIYKSGSKSIQEYHNFEEMEYMHHITYDDNNKEIEIKVIRNEDDIEEGDIIDLMYWVKNEYDDLGNLIKEISFNHKGEEDGITVNSYFDNGLLKSSKTSSKEYNYEKTFEYLFNLKEHWIRKTEYHDGLSACYYERTIQYY